MENKHAVYIIDDSYVQVPDEIKNMTHEERMREIRRLEEQGRKEGENIPYPKL